MTTYKAIHGKTLLHVASDLDTAEGEGQIWFNTTSNDYKTIVKAAAVWASGANINTARTQVKGCGTNTATLITAGQTTAYGNAPVGINELYDGSSWTEVGDLNTVRRTGAEFGTSTAAVYVGGANADGDSLAVCEKWNGTAWTEVADLNTATVHFGGAGISTAGIVSGGTRLTETETWDGTSWTEVADLNTGRYNIGVAGKGSTTASLVFAGETPPPTAQALTETWDGSSWTEVGDLNNSVSAGSGSGTQTNAARFGGAPASGKTELWDGSSWINSTDLSTGRIYLAGAGAAGPSAIAVGGGANPPNSNATEEFSFSSTLAAGAWASGGNLNTGRNTLGGSGTQTAT